MAKSKTVNFIHTYKGAIAAFGMLLIVIGFTLSYVKPQPGTKVDTQWFKGEIPTMAFVGTGLILIPYLTSYLIQTVAAKFGKKTEPPQG